MSADAARVQGSGIGIVGIAACLPTAVRDNGWWPPGWASRQAADPTRLAQAEVSADAPDSVRRWAGDPFQGARLRRVIDDGHESSHLEVAACHAALQHAGWSAHEVDTLLGYSQVPDDAGPGNHGIVAREVGLRHEVLALTVEAGCASFLPHLSLACRLGARALLYQSSASSRVSDPADGSSVLTGDGAVAEVVGPVGEGLGFVDAIQFTRGDLRDGLVLGPREPGGRWTDGGSPLVVTARDPAQAVQMGVLGPTYCREACVALLERHGLTPGDVDFFACAQSAAWFSAACAEALEIPPSRTVPPEDHFQRYGHLLAASAPLNLWVAWATGRLTKGDLVLVYSPGVGFTQAAHLMRWTLDPPRRGRADPVAP